MKKLYIVTIAILALLSGCNKPSLPTIQPDNTTALKEDFYIKDDYLWKNDKKLSDKTVKSLILRENPGLDQVDIWHVIEKSAETSIFLLGAGGCEGCVLLMPKYFVISNKDKTIAVQEFKDADLSYLFERGAIDSFKVLISPDKTKIAFVKPPDDFLPDENQESVWIFNLLTGEETKVATIQEGHSLVDLNLIYWNSDSKTLTIKVPNEPANSQEKKEYSFSLGSLISTLPYNKNISSLKTFDFNQDNVDEQIVYFKQPLAKPVSTRYGKTDWNGAFEIFQRKDHKWISLYADEGTVGKKEYAVYNLINEEDFFTIIDFDDDGVKEVEITTTHDGSGTYTDSYILKWNGQKIAKTEVIDSKTNQELAKMFLKANESLGPGGLKYINICPADNSTCAIKQNATDTIGQIIKRFEYKDGRFTAIGYKRKNF